MTLKHGLVASAAIVALAWPQMAAADPASDARIQALEAQLADLAAQVAALKQQQTGDVETLSAQVTDLKTSTGASLDALRTDATSTQASIPNGKPTIATSDGRFSATLHGVMQLDTAKYFQDRSLPASVAARDLNSGVNFRRARLGVDGKLYGAFDYNLLLDFGGSGAEDTGRVQELWIQYSAFKPWRFRVGAFAPPLGLEDAASTNGALFAERPAAADVARNLAGGDTRLGAGVIGNGDHWFASAVVTSNLVSSFNSGATAFNAATFDEQLGYALRIAGTPLHGYDWLVHVGANAGVVAQPADLGPTAAARYAIQLRERPELRVDGTRLVDTGAIDAAGARALGLEFAAQKKNLLLQAEYFDIKIDRRHPAAGVQDPRFSGWYVEGGWVLTGEARKYNLTTAAFDAPAVDKPFDPLKNQWGAWELAARYSTLDLNDHADSAVVANRVRGGEQRIWTAGLNWFPNPATKFMLDVQDVSVKRRNAAGAQLGQDYRSVNLRSQFAF
ncbi:OprO/OprP family phosphate-selective porin [Phenylobacterium sp.]|jgi:phosphate-selective porin OprO/OprP|uniref:OprO/OprP family phosphate-selective porin n=1 Tax=Phenylobacterium sp. TaxID=1871053 RepID=UPI002F416C6D